VEKEATMTMERVEKEATTTMERAEKETTTTMERAEKERAKAREAKEETMTLTCAETTAIEFRHHNAAGPFVEIQQSPPPSVDIHIRCARTVILLCFLEIRGRSETFVETCV
jgi:hypothetical protein